MRAWMRGKNVCMCVWIRTEMCVCVCESGPSRGKAQERALSSVMIACVSGASLRRQQTLVFGLRARLWGKAREELSSFRLWV